MIGFFKFLGSVFSALSFWTHLEVRLESGSDLSVKCDHNVLSTDVNKVVFYLYPNARKPEYSEVLVLGNRSSVKHSHYKASLPLILLIHGFLSNSSDGLVLSVKKAYLDTSFKANIVAVDWGALSMPNSSASYLFYNLAVANVPRVADRVAAFIQFMMDIKALSGPANVQIVGHSLGAHVSGLAGQKVNATTGKLIGRISGLDPAAPDFQLEPPERRLDKSDAAFVDAYHTNQGVKGYLGHLGHVDFYPNGGGPFQPGCSNATDFSDIVTGTCSHARAYLYFAESIRNSSIMACRCRSNDDLGSVTEDCKTHCQEPIVFGQFCPRSARGKYYLQIIV